MGIFRVLIVEDDSSLRTQLVKRLERNGLIATGVASAMEAYNLMKREVVDVLVIDYHLPNGLTGLDFYRQLTVENMAIPAIMATGVGDETIVTAALRAGIRDFLPKNETLLENLPLAVQAVLEDIQRETQLRSVELERVTYEATSAALDAAGIGLLVWDTIKKEALISPQLERIVGVNADSFKDLRSILSSIHPRDRRRVIESLRVAWRSDAPLETEFQTYSGNQWIRVKGRFDKTRLLKEPRLLIMLWDETEKHVQEQAVRQAHTETSRLADRLQLSMLEIHHRVKNSFQIVSSLLNMELRRHGTLSKDDVNRVNSYVQGLALIHDMLTDQAKATPGEFALEACRLIESICKSLSQGSCNAHFALPRHNCSVVPRVASSLAVIATELIINAMKHGCEEEVTVEVIKQDEARAILSVRNQMPPTQPPKEAVEVESTKRPSSVGTGSSLVEFLARTDLNSTVDKGMDSDGEFFVTVSFPLAKLTKKEGTTKTAPSSLPH